MSKNMLAAYLISPKNLVLKERPIPRPERNEVLVKIMACGVCPTDIRYFLGYGKHTFYGEESYGLTGHEWSGVVIEVGEDVEKIRINDRVVVDHIASCGACRYCRRNLTHHCINKRYYLRGYAEYGLAYGPTLLKLPEKISFEEACFVEPLSSCINSIERASISMGEVVAIIGDGVIGMLHLQLAKLRGAEVVMIGHHNDRLEISEKIGADYTFNSKEVDIYEEISRLTDNYGVDAVIVATQGTEALESALRIVGKSSRIIVFSGTYPEEKISINPNRIHYSEISIIGASEHNVRQFTTSLKLIEKGLVRVKPLISNIVPLIEIDRAFDIVMNRRGLKTIVRPHQEDE
ncbi:MAG: zinc-binding dehydrogenase [Thaumarchaeota archaeon]|jgi:L-iditol 2-dehydrogenase|nr:zinc-binding dehydrogenase [Candidatus Geocrenenecus arthurdayi]